MSRIRTYLRTDPVAGGAATVELQRSLLMTEISSVLATWQDQPLVRRAPATDRAAALVTLMGQIVAEPLTVAMMDGANELHQRAFTEGLVTVFRQSLTNALTYNMAMNLSEQEEVADVG